MRDLSKLPKWAQELILKLQSERDGEIERRIQAEDDALRYIRREAEVSGILYQLTGTCPDDPHYQERIAEVLSSRQNAGQPC